MSRNLSNNLNVAPNSIYSSIYGLPYGVWGILLVSLIIKLSLIGMNQGEYTDGIIQLELWRSPVVFFPPGYSAAVWGIDGIIKNLLISGRLVSILASVGSLLVCYLISKIVFSEEKLAFLSTLFLALSPVFNRWSLRVMTDSLFLLLFLICVYQLLVLLQNTRKSPVRFLGWIGLASLIRYQGLYFIPFVLYLFWKRRSVIAERGIVRQAVAFLTAVIPWLLLFYWIGDRGFGHTQQFTDRASFGFWTTLSLYFSMFETFLLYWPWAVTYGLFVTGIIGGMELYAGNERKRGFIYFFLITAVVFLIVQSCFLSFQYRYLLPLVPLWCILAAKGWSVCEAKTAWQTLRRMLGALVIANLLFLSAAVLYFQRATFGDITASAEFLQSAKFQRVVPSDSRILSDEAYRQGVYNVKMQFWAGEERDILYYPQVEPQAGDVLILHNAYTDLTQAKEQLEKQFNLKRLQTFTFSRFSVWDDFVTLPLLPDIMVNPPKVPLTSNPQCMAYRFAPQGFYSVVLLLEEK